MKIWCCYSFSFVFFTQANLPKLFHFTDVGFLLCCGEHACEAAIVPGLTDTGWSCQGRPVWIQHRGEDGTIAQMGGKVDCVYQVTVWYFCLASVFRFRTWTGRQCCLSSSIPNLFLLYCSLVHAANVGSVAEWVALTRKGSVSFYHLGILHPFTQTCRLLLRCNPPKNYSHLGDKAIVFRFFFSSPGPGSVMYRDETWVK